LQKWLIFFRYVFGHARKELKYRKSCGPEGLSPKAIKFGGNKLVVHLTFDS